MNNNDNLKDTTEQFKDNANKLKNVMIHDNNSRYIKPNIIKPIIFISIIVGIISLCVSGVFPTIFSTIFSTIFPAIFIQFSEIFRLMLTFLYSVISLLLWYFFVLILYVIPILILLAVLAYRSKPNENSFFEFFDILIKYASLAQSDEDKNDTTINIFYKYCVMKIFSYKFKNTIKTNTIFINAGICYLAICITENKDENNQKFLGIYGTWIPLPF